MLFRKIPSTLYHKKLQLNSNLNRPFTNTKRKTKPISTLTPAVSTNRFTNVAPPIIDTSDLFVAISELNEEHNISLKAFPHVPVFGPQSSGKSSVIEALAGYGILPKAMKISTLKPMYLTMIRTSHTKFKIGDREVFTEEEAAQEIDRLNNNSHIKQINVTIWAPDVYNMILIDLPGLFCVASKDNADFPKKVKDLTIAHLQDPNCIPVMVHAAPSDPATNQAINLLNKYGRDTDAIGILTKVDLLKDQNITFINDMLTGKSYPLGEGYCAVVLRSEKDIENGVSINEKIKQEAEFFSKFKLKPSGVVQMRKKISDTQFKRIKDQIPQLIDDIDKQINDLNLNHSFMHNLLNNEQGSLVSQIGMMLEKFYGESLERAEFEEKLKPEFHKLISSYLDEMLESASISSSINKNLAMKLSPNKVNSHVASFNRSRMTNPNEFKTDSIKELFGYGLRSSTYIDNTIIKAAYEKEIGLALCVPMIDPSINDPLGKNRTQLIRFLNAYFSKLLKDDHIHKLIYDITEKAVIEYICNDLEGCDESTKKFIEYMVKEIGHEAYESNIKYSITAILNLEKRPQVSVVEVIRYLTQMYPSYFTFNNGILESFIHENHKLCLEIYSEAWNTCYLKVVANNLAENTYRNVAVNLLDLMVKKLLERCMDLISKKNATKEKNTINESIVKLKKIRNIMVSYNNIE